MTTTPDTARTDTAGRLAEIRARAEAATPGHWGVHYDGNGTYTIEAQPRHIPGVGSVREGDVATLHGAHEDAQPYHDSGFMARAREDVPWLLDRVAELEALVKDLTAVPPGDRAALRERIAEAIWARTPEAEPSPAGLVMGNPHGIADAVLAVLPAPADRAAVLWEAAVHVEAMNEACDNRKPCESCTTRQDIATELRRMADPAQPTGQHNTHQGMTFLACNWARTRHPHSRHDWEPQSGMDPVRCPGWSEGEPQS